MKKIQRQLLDVRYASKMTYQVVMSVKKNKKQFDIVSNLAINIYMGPISVRNLLPTQATILSHHII